MYEIVIKLAMDPLLTLCTLNTEFKRKREKMERRIVVDLASCTRKREKRQLLPEGKKLKLIIFEFTKGLWHKQEQALPRTCSADCSYVSYDCLRQNLGSRFVGGLQRSPCPFSCIGEAFKSFDAIIRSIFNYKR